MLENHSEKCGMEYTNIADRLTEAKNNFVELIEHCRIDPDFYCSEDVKKEPQMYWKLQKFLTFSTEDSYNETVGHLCERAT